MSHGASVTTDRRERNEVVLTMEEIGKAIPSLVALGAIVDAANRQTSGTLAGCR